MREISVLFICIGNTCRSPMAEAITRSIGGDDVTASSVGLMPYGTIAPTTIETLEGLGHDTDGLRSKGFGEIELDRFDIIVSLIGHAGLGPLPGDLGAELECWSIRDPFGEDEEIYLAVARELEGRIRELLAEHTARELPLA
jgi:arsenate reductase